MLFRSKIEAIITTMDREALLLELNSAAVARRALPGRGVSYEQLVVILVPVDDRPGVLATITNLASELNINIFDIGISHSVEGSAGVLQISVEHSESPQFIDALVRAGYRAVSET